SLTERYWRPSFERLDHPAPISTRPTYTRWLGALSLPRLVSGTMRTPLVWTLRVTISPWNSLPTFLKEPMLAMLLLLAVLEPATTAASMAIGRPRTIDDAPVRAGAQRRMTAERPPPSGGQAFLPREEWANRGPTGLAPHGVEGPGEESRPDVVAA